MAELVLLKAEDCVPLRREVLRPRRPKKESLYPQDDDDRSTHYGVRQRDKTLGVISMLHDQRGGIGSEMWRIRGMAVLADEQRKGYGGMLLKTIQAIATKRGGGLWANVRTGVVEYYRSHGFSEEGDVFDLKGIGPHVVMTWRPKP
jgi:GNAT superfamily N-acetyltransferase